jgi:4-amino-4-deoxy-L-arabinose transferase-like glycosyltransferase
LIFSVLSFLAFYFELIDDEVCYNLWSSSITFGYYDHVPMIAWWIYAGKFVFGETVIVVRILTYVAFFLVSILIARMVF